MTSFLLVVFILYFWALFWLYNEEITLDKFKQDPLIIKLKKWSYIGVIINIKDLGYEYSTKKYMIQSIVIAAGFGWIAYYTTDTIFYSVILISGCIFLLPYYNMLQLKTKYRQMVEDNIFAYVSNSLVYLRENSKTVIEIITDCLPAISNPLKNDIEECLKHISMTGDFDLALDMLEKKYNHTILKNLHDIFKVKYHEGALNILLYSYLYDNVNDYELILSDYRKKYIANRSVFYIMVLLEMFAIFLIVNMFGSSEIVDLKTPFFQAIIWAYYVLNIATVMYYEKWCSKNNFSD